MTSPLETLPFIVVGGGIGGVATALALSRKGYRVQVLERAEAFREIGAGIQMPPNAFAAFAALGVLKTIQQVAAYPKELAFGDLQSGEILYRAPIDEAFVERFGYPYALLHRGDVLESLVAACRASDLITLTSGQRVFSFRDVGDKVVVKTASGGSYEGCGLVACDGLWSIGREIRVGDGPPRTDGYVLCRGVIPVTLLGDAAHPTNVYVSQGACMALEDAVVLAESVAEANSIEEGFKRYEAKRLLRTARIQFTSREFGKLYHADGVLRHLRNSLLPTLRPTALSDTLDWMWRNPFRENAERAEDRSTLIASRS